MQNTNHLCTIQFVLIINQLWCKDSKKHQQHKMVVPCDWHLFLIASAYNDIGHHRVIATNALLSEQYLWPVMSGDVTWYIGTCLVCQQQRTQQSFISSAVAMPAPLFSKVYMDTMHMPLLSGYKYIIQSCCSLSYWLEWAMLAKENTVTLGKWILHDIIYCWGLLLEIITNNGPAFLKALAYLERHYHIKHIRISSYNSHANSIVERSHFKVREAIFKACNRDKSKWSGMAYSVFWAERVTVRHRMGCLPYFAVAGTHPLLPIDIAKANYLLLLPDSILSSTDLIT